MDKKKKRIIAASIIATIIVVATSIFVIRYLLNRNKKYSSYYNQKVALFAEQNQSIVKGETDIVFIGDSLTDLYPVDSYYPEYNVLNRGIGGDTTYGLYDRLDVSLYQVEPKVVVMLIGANNFSSMLNNYESIVEDINANLPNTKLVILSLTALGGRWAERIPNESVIDRNVALKEIANRHSCTFVDLFTPLYNTETGEVYDGYTIDGGHFTETGYNVVTSTIMPVVKAILEE